MESINTKPLLPLRDIVIFPSMVVPLFVGREKSIKALQEAMKEDKSIVLVAQKNSEIDEPVDTDLYSYGCVSKILQLLKPLNDEVQLPFSKGRFFFLINLKISLPTSSFNFLLKSEFNIDFNKSVLLSK